MSQPQHNCNIQRNNQLDYQLKCQPEDFVVREEMNHVFSGHGEHLWLFVRKRNLTTDVVRSLLARVFDVSPAQVGYAGKKDRQAITFQWFSVHLPGRADSMRDQVKDLLQEFLEARPLYHGETLTVEQAHVHQKKCQVGCHQGNFFEIQVSTKQVLTDDQLKSAADSVQQHGFPNLFGEQRFGHDGENLETLEQSLLKAKKAKPGRLKPKDAWACSQIRSYLFNQVTLQRLQWPGWPAVVPGDIMNLTGSGSHFTLAVDASEQEIAECNARASSGDISITGPLFGNQSSSSAEGEMQLLEARVLQTLTEPARNVLHRLQSHSRRPLIIRPKTFEITATKAGYACKLWLPKGAYATVCVDYFHRSLACT